MPKYYTYNQQKYSICFPLEWAINHFEQTGPTECADCREYGCDDSIFKQYCDNCQLYEYMGTRTTDEYCHAATRQPTQTIEIMDSTDMSVMSDISDISDNEASWSGNNYHNNHIYDGNSECKASVISLESDESRSRSSVMPILHKYLDNHSIFSNIEIHSEQLHLPPSYI